VRNRASQSEGTGAAVSGTGTGDDTGTGTEWAGGPDAADGRPPSQQSPHRLYHPPFVREYRSLISKTIRDGAPAFAEKWGVPARGVYRPAPFCSFLSSRRVTTALMRWAREGITVRIEGCFRMAFPSLWPFLHVLIFAFPVLHESPSPSLLALALPPRA